MKVEQTGFAAGLHMAFGRVPIRISTRFLTPKVNGATMNHPLQFSHSVVWDSVIPWTAARQAYLSITSSQSLLKLMSTHLVMPSNHLIICSPLLLPSVFPSIKIFSNESVLCISWPKYWHFSLSISPSSEYSGLISFREKSPY